MTENPQEIHEQIVALIDGATNILVTSHRDCDGDSVGSQLAILDFVRSRRGPKAKVTVVQHGSLPQTLAFLPGNDVVHDITATDLKLSNEDYDLAIVLECPQLDRAGDVCRLISDQTRIINIDHHLGNDNYGEVNWVNSTASSVGEMLCLLFESVGFDFSVTTAERLYTAILTDTGRFRFASTSAISFAVAGRLVAKGVDVQRVCDEIYYKRRPESIKLTGLALSSVEFFVDSRVCMISVSREICEEARANKSDTEGLVDYTLLGADTEVGALLRENGTGGVKVSLRSRKKIDVARIASAFGGGGHHNAAGCLIRKPLSEVKEVIRQRLVQTVNE